MPNLEILCQFCAKSRDFVPKMTHFCVICGKNAGFPSKMKGLYTSKNHRNRAEIADLWVFCGYFGPKSLEMSPKMMKIPRNEP